ncbi:MAG: hypothetical protein ACREUU_01120 [Gammaproteobacteria bacterium]
MDAEAASRNGSKVNPAVRARSLWHVTHVFDNTGKTCRWNSSIEGGACP